MNLTRIAMIAVLIAAAGPAALAQEGGGLNQPRVLTAEQRESMQRATALFLITLIVIVVTIAGLVVFSLLRRRRARKAAERKPPMPTELEDLWWKMNLPEDRDEKKGPLQ